MGRSEEQLILIFSQKQQAQNVAQSPGLWLNQWWNPTQDYGWTQEQRKLPLLNTNGDHFRQQRDIKQKHMKNHAESRFMPI